MNNSIKNIIFVIIAIALLFFSCDNENDFYEVGRQPVHLLEPSSDTIWILNYQKPNFYRFRWTSKRNFIDFNLVFSLSENLTEKRIEISTGIKNDFKINTIQMDSILSSMDIQIGKKALVYWSVSVVDPEAGWCDEVRKIDITR